MWDCVSTIANCQDGGAGWITLKFPMMTLITAASCGSFLIWGSSQPWLPRAPCWNSWQLLLSAMNSSSQQLSPAITASYSCSPRVPLLLTCSNNLQQHLDLSGAAHLSISLSAALLKNVLWQCSNGAILLIWRAGLVFKPPIPPTLTSFYGTRHRGILLLTASSALLGSWSSISFSSELFIMHTKSNFQVVSYS